MLIVVEGVDCSGKATQSQRLANDFGGVLFAFPNYGSPTGRIIKEHLRGEWRACADPDPGVVTALRPPDTADQLNAHVFQCAMTVDKYALAPAIEHFSKRTLVVLDRYWPSAWVYGVADGLDASWLTAIHEHLPRPDLFILLDVDLATMIERQKARGRPADRYERDALKMAKVIDLYRKLWIGRHALFSTQWITIDGRADVETVQGEIREAIKAVTW